MSEPPASHTDTAKHDKTSIKSSKSIIVVKRRRKPVLVQRTTVPSRRAIGPSRSNNYNLTRTIPRPLEEPQDNDADNDDFDALLLENAPCETLMVLQSLISNPATSIAIPFATTTTNQAQIYIYGVLPCQLYNALHDTSTTQGDVVVSRELQQLLHESHELISLSEAGKPSADDAVQVLVPAQEYSRAIKSIMSKTDEDIKAMDWFVRHLQDYKLEGSGVISVQSLQRVFAKDPISGMTADDLIKILCQLQVILPCHRPQQSSSSSYYQFWLPTWGLVLQAWNKTVGRLLLQLKQSHYKERAEQALVQSQRHCPIPTRLILDWLVEQGKVERLDRASGSLIRLIADDE